MTPHLTTIHDPQTTRELAATHPAQAALAGRKAPPKGRRVAPAVTSAPRATASLGSVRAVALLIGCMSRWGAPHTVALIRFHPSSRHAGFGRRGHDDNGVHL